MALEQNYIDQYIEMHKHPNMFPGQQTILISKYISPILNRYSCSTLLDYGCGKALQYFNHALHKKWGVKVALFDIGVPEYSVKPEGVFDAVICIDVLEHIEEHNVLEILKEFNDYSTKVVVVSIATRPAKKHLPDGRNAHLTIQNDDWWFEKIQQVSTKPWFVMFEPESTGKDRKFNFAYVNVPSNDIEWYSGLVSELE
jgi:hypothetical protein